MRKDKTNQSDSTETGWVPCDSCKTHKTFRHKAGEKVFCNTCHAREWQKIASKDSG